MKGLILSIFCGIINLVYCASSSNEYLDLDSAPCRLASVKEPSIKLKRRFECFLRDPDFLERSVICALEDKMPEIPHIAPWMDCQQLLKTACNLKRLHFLTGTLKEAYENIFYLLEFSIESLNPEDTSRLWSCVSECGYRLPAGFFKRLDSHTAKQSDSFSCTLALSTLRHLSVLPAGRAFSCFVPILSRINELHSPDDFHNFMFLRVYITEVKAQPVVPKKSMSAALDIYQERAVHKVKTSASQLELVKFLQEFEPRFACEVFHESLDTHLDIANEASKIVVDMDGFHHGKEDPSTSKRFRRPLDLMRDSILLGRGWKVYRIRVDEWDSFKAEFATKMTERNTLETFYKMYTVGG